MGAEQEVEAARVGRVGVMDGAVRALGEDAEAGQLAFVAVVLGLRWLIEALSAPLPVWAVRAPVYAMGGLAVYWCLDRGSQLIGFG